MLAFPTTSSPSSPIQKTSSRRRRNDPDATHGPVATAITPRLYLSDLYSACAAGNLERLGITHIVSAIEADVSASFGRNVMVMHVPIRDEVHANIARWFDKVVKFIQDALGADELHKVLVHCLQGVSRSATLVCAYLVATTAMRAKEAIAHVQAKRGIVAPNIGFRRQLVDWERQFEETKARAEEERRKRGRSAGVLGEVLSRWMGRGRAVASVVAGSDE